MMREHMGLFRGKRIDNGEWVEGAYCKHDTVKVFLSSDDPKTKHLIVADAFCDWGFEPALVGHEVDPDTVGECCGGLRDKNGKLIFEGDIFSIEDEIVAVVIFQDGCFRMEEYGLCGTWTESGFDECGGGWGVIQCDPIDWYTIGDMEAIGNVTDNPELLKGGVAT